MGFFPGLIHSDIEGAPDKKSNHELICWFPPRIYAHQGHAPESHQQWHDDARRIAANIAKLSGLRASLRYAVRRGWYPEQYECRPTRKVTARGLPLNRYGSRKAVTLYCGRHAFQAFANCRRTRTGRPSGIRCRPSTRRWTRLFGS